MISRVHIMRMITEIILTGLLHRPLMPKVNAPPVTGEHDSYKVGCVRSVTMLFF